MSDRRKRSGRPSKYAPGFVLLDDNTLYGPKEIWDVFKEKGFLDDKSDLPEKELRVRVRHAMARWAKNHQFDPEGDGFVDRIGQMPCVAWLGRRWKNSYSAAG